MRILRRLLTCLFLLAALPAAADILLDEDFEDGVADAFTPLAGDWLVTGGVYHCYVAGNDVYALTFAGEPTWFDYRFAGRMMVQGGVNHVLRVRAGADVSYEFVVRSGGYSDAYLYKWDQGVRTELAGIIHPGFATGTWHDFEVVVFGARFWFAWDDQVFFDHVDTDSPQLAGGIMLAAHAGGAVQWQDAHFDDLIVELLTTAQGNTSWGAVKALY